MSITGRILATVVSFAVISVSCTFTYNKSAASEYTIIEIYDAYEDFTLEQNDGEIWKYKLEKNGVLSMLQEKDNIAWREGSGSYVGVGVNPSSIENGLVKPIELNSIGNSLGILEFKAPETGIYLINSFRFSRIDGWAEPGMVLFVRYEGEPVFVSDSLTGTSLGVEQIFLEMEKGETIHFYANYSPPGNSFSNCFVENLRIKRIEGDIEIEDHEKKDEIADLENPHKSGTPYVIEEGKISFYDINSIRLAFNSETGDLVGMDVGNLRINMDGAIVDVGIKTGLASEYIRDTQRYSDLDILATYEIPNIGYNITKPKESGEVTFIYHPDDKGITVCKEFADIKIYTTYEIYNGTVEISAEVKNSGDERVIVNGMSFALRNIIVDNESTLHFPGNLPYSLFNFSEMSYGATYSTQYSGPLTQITSKGAALNIIFVNPGEKWRSAVVKSPANNPQRLHTVSLAAVQSYLDPGESLSCGSLYVQMIQEGEDPYKPVVDLYSSMGWKAPEDGIREGGVYSGHPAGTSDGFLTGSGREFSDRADKTLTTYADELQSVKDLGFDNFWLLPVFEHSHHAGSVYLSYNQEIIDQRYGGEEAAKIFGERANEAGLNLMIDYVPHGPPPTIGGNENPWLTPKRWGWVTKDRSGDYRMEWGCVAMDYTNPEYLDYFKNLVEEQAGKFGFSGTRIDCAMGSLPNWEPAEGFRPSNNNFMGGMLMTKAIRDGFLKAGKTPLVMPENFHPLPYYAPYTDFFYDMAFYNMTLSLRNEGVSELRFAYEISRWLQAQEKSRATGQIFVRFLGNHDTVAQWYSNYDNARPEKIYGSDKVRALWVLLATIDGVPMIYQGDEIGNRDFFSQLMSMRAEYLGTHYSIEYYLEEKNGIIAYNRLYDGNNRLVLVNLTNSEESRDFDFDTEDLEVVYGSAQKEEKTVTLQPYGYVVLVESSQVPDYSDENGEEPSGNTFKYIIFSTAVLIILFAISAVIIRKVKKQ